MKGKNIFWGAFFILAAAFILLSSLGYLPEVGLIQVVITLLLIPVFVKSVIHLSFYGIFFPIAIIGILYSEFFNIDSLTPWPILGIALFLSIGFTFIVKPRPDTYFSADCKEMPGDRSEDNSGTVNINTRFSGSVKYVTSKQLEKVNITTSFCGVKVYLDNAVPLSDNVEVNIDASFSGVELYVPKEWRVINRVDCSMGGFDVKGMPTSDVFTNTIIISGYAKCSGITLIRV